MLPTNFFKDPDVMSLSSSDVRLILVGLVLNADDYGRGLAHPNILGRDLDFTPEQIEGALPELEQADLVRCYQGGKHRYYALLRWEEWQTLTKRSPSKFPAPPEIDQPAPHDMWQIPGNAREILENSGKSGEVRENTGTVEKILSEGEGEQEREREGKRIGGGDESNPLPKIVAFPATRISAGDATTDSQIQIMEATKKVAAILKLTVTDALTRIVAEYLHDPSLSLLGEADSAREWIDDPGRNRRRQRLTPAFFRRWLQREREAYQRRHASIQPALQQATGTLGSGSGMPVAKVPVYTGEASVHAPYPENAYQAYVARRLRELEQSPEDGSHEETS